MQYRATVYCFGIKDYLYKFVCFLTEHLLNVCSLFSVCFIVDVFLQLIMLCTSTCTGNISEGDTPLPLAYCVLPYFDPAYCVLPYFDIAYCVPFNKGK